MKHATLLAAASVLLLTAPALARDPTKACTQAPQAEWKTHEAAKAKLEGEGYKVRKIETEKNCFEVYTTDKDGKKVELFLDPVSLAVVESVVD